MGPVLHTIIYAVCFSFKSFYFMVFFTLVYLSTWVNEPTGVEGLSFFHFATDYDIALFNKCCSENMKCTWDNTRKFKFSGGLQLSRSERQKVFNRSKKNWGLETK